MRSLSKDGLVDRGFLSLQVTASTEGLWRTAEALKGKALPDDLVSWHQSEIAESLPIVQKTLNPEPYLEDPGT